MLNYLRTILLILCWWIRILRLKKYEFTKNSVIQYSLARKISRAESEWNVSTIGRWMSATCWLFLSRWKLCDDLVSITTEITCTNFLPDFYHYNNKVRKNVLLFIRLLESVLLLQSRINRRYRYLEKLGKYAILSWWTTQLHFTLSDTISEMSTI